MASIKDLQDQMNKNSQAWHGANKAEQDRLHKENERLQSQIDSMTGVKLHLQSRYWQVEHHGRVPAPPGPAAWAGPGPAAAVLPGRPAVTGARAVMATAPAMARTPADRMITAF